MWQAVRAVASGHVRRLTLPEGVRYGGLLATLHWLISGIALLVAAFAVARARWVAARCERLADSYWELRYEHGQLRARVARLEGAPDSGAADQPAVAPQTAPATFIPLSTLKR